MPVWMVIKTLPLLTLLLVLKQPELCTDSPALLVLLKTRMRIWDKQRKTWRGHGRQWTESGADGSSAAHLWQKTAAGTSMDWEARTEWPCERNHARIHDWSTIPQRWHHKPKEGWDIVQFKCLPCPIGHTQESPRVSQQMKQQLHLEEVRTS